MISDESNTSVLRAALTKVLGGAWRIDVEGAAAPSGAAAANTPEPDPRDEVGFEPDPQAAPPPPQQDPETEAMRLLHDKLGARPLDG
jgi:hypothetical protein